MTSPAKVAGILHVIFFILLPYSTLYALSLTYLSEAIPRLTKYLYFYTFKPHIEVLMANKG